MKKLITVIVPNNIQVQMTGAYELRKFAHSVRLTYTDGTTEDCPLNKLGAVDWDDWFSIVSAIQAQRKA